MSSDNWINLSIGIVSSLVASGLAALFSYFFLKDAIVDFVIKVLGLKEKIQAIEDAENSLSTDVREMIDAKIRVVTNNSGKIKSDDLNEIKEMLQERQSALTVSVAKLQSAVETMDKFEKMKKKRANNG
ncbi:MAG: hypothetical protein COV37_16460 [Bdellovibrio sp. CG11_big_fil_rev_8_21_14_0_20_39_38]|nr:MAG: hypothetical protein COW78_14930 [Bdellovibrio sp. CG22_combo_CG10-13_8_21_14_all_39_27]PIR33372.1 MAG: hypothetical protein COV37_16460 [Bdellovibrio sp. CG11_big_fil_rev_8_21_14_0_20_39_38]